MRVLVFLVLLAGEALAQVASATLSGTVLDESGAVAPAAAITAREEGAGFTRSTETGAEGGYAIEDLPPGWYTVTAAKPGFRTTTSEHVLLTVNQKARLDLRLSVGPAHESVKATGSTHRLPGSCRSISATSRRW